MDNQDYKADLIHKISQGDSNAFRLFYDFYYEKINRFVSYLIADPEAIQDIISDVFISIWQERDKLTRIRHFDSYLYTSVRNKALDYINQSKKSISLDHISLGIMSTDPTPDETFESKELNEKIRIAIDSLPERCKLIFLLAKEEGLSYKDIAKILNISEKTVNAQMVIAFKKLRLILGDYLGILLFFFL